MFKINVVHNVMHMGLSVRIDWCNEAALSYMVNISYFVNISTTSENSY